LTATNEERAFVDGVRPAIERAVAAAEEKHLGALESEYATFIEYRVEREPALRD
jgi:hypothetical protein